MGATSFLAGVQPAHDSAHCVSAFHPIRLATFSLAMILLGSVHVAMANGESRRADAWGFARPTPREVPTRAVLQAFLQTTDETYQSHHARKRNRFCFVTKTLAADQAGTQAVTFMIWHEGQKILSFSQSTDDSLDDETRGHSLAIGKSIDLTSDVVDTAEQIGGSSYLVDRPWVRRMLAQCRQVGRTVIFTPRSARLTHAASTTRRKQPPLVPD